MWRTSSAEPERRERLSAGETGFGLPEALVSLLILAIVMTAVLALLLSLRSFAGRQRAHASPRQAAGRAVETLFPFLQGATDLNAAAGNPNALVMVTEWGTDTVSTRRRATYDNLTGGEPGNATFVVNPKAPAAQRVTSTRFGSVGSDVVSLSVARAPARIPLEKWGGNDPAVQAAWASFRGGCGRLDASAHPAYTAQDDADNLAAFKRAVGARPDPVRGGEASDLLIVADGAGRWRYLLIDRFLSSNCAAPGGDVVQFGFAAGSAPQLQPPGGFRSDLDPGSATLLAGLDFVSFRHRTVLDSSDPAGTRTVGQIEQKRAGSLPSGAFDPGIFDPAVDGTPDSLFAPVLDGVADLQIGWVFRDGSIWNDAPDHVLPVSQNRVPLQARTGGGVDCARVPLSGADLDVACVVALRLGVVGHQELPFESRQLTERRLHVRPALANRPAGAEDSAETGVFDWYPMTATLLIRNRALGF